MELADGAAMDNPLWDESYGWVQGFVADISAWSGQVMREPPRVLRRLGYLSPATAAGVSFWS